MIIKIKKLNFFFFLGIKYFKNSSFWRRIFLIGEFLKLQMEKKKNDKKIIIQKKLILYLRIFRCYGLVSILMDTGIRQYFGWILSKWIIFCQNPATQSHLIYGKQKKGKQDLQTVQSHISKMKSTAIYLLRNYAINSHET